MPVKWGTRNKEPVKVRIEKSGLPIFMPKYFIHITHGITGLSEPFTAYTLKGAMKAGKKGARKYFDSDNIVYEGEIMEQNIVNDFIEVFK